MFLIQSTFIAKFKVGDNICHNLKILSLLYSYLNKETTYNQKLLTKPIIILIVSIIEAILDDFFMRINKFVIEGVPSLPTEVIQKIRSKKITKFEHYIVCIEKYNLFNTTAEFYKLIDNLRRLRHRIHIQNTKNFAEEDEDKAFSYKRMKLAEKACEWILWTMQENYSRGINFVDNFQIPWESHFPDKLNNAKSIPF